MLRSQHEVERLAEHIAEAINAAWMNLSVTVLLQRREVLTRTIEEAIRSWSPYEPRPSQTSIISDVASPSRILPSTPPPAQSDLPIAPDEGLNPNSPRELP